MSWKYLDKGGLEYLLYGLRDRFASYDDVKEFVGLKVVPLSPDGKTLTISSVVQGDYYYSDTAVNNIQFGEFYGNNVNIMGEAVIQFKTDEEPDMGGIVSNSGTKSWKWYQNGTWIQSPVFKSNSLYIIHITTGHNDEIFAEVSRFEPVYIPGGGGSDDGEGGGNGNPEEKEDPAILKITYSTTGDVIEVLNHDWIKNYCGLVDRFLFAADGVNYTLVYTETLVKNNKLKCTSTSPKLLVELNLSDVQDGESNCNINLSDLLYDISFSEFEVENLPAKRIKSMYRMFGTKLNSNVYPFTKVDLTGIDAPDEFFHYDSAESKMFQYMFVNRKMHNDADGSKLKLFGNGCGISTKKATTLKGMFMNGPLLDVHCNTVLNGLEFHHCTDFSYMFSGYNATQFKLNKNAVLNTISKSYSFEEMFSKSQISSNALTEISNLLSKINIESRSVNFKSMFEGCTNIQDGDLFNFNSIFDRRMAWLESINMESMFKDCYALSHAPVVKLTHEGYHESINNLNLKSMFENAGKSADLNFSEFENWVLNFTTAFENKNVNGTQNIIDMTRMFYGCPLYKIKNSKGNLFTFCSGDSKHISSKPLCSEMFAQTSTDTNKCSIRFNMWTGSYLDYKDLLKDKWWEGLEGMLSKNSYISINCKNAPESLRVPHEQSAIIYYGLRTYYYTDLKDVGINYIY